MCGIIGYVGSRPCLPFLLEGLERLEYRGYDSAGVAWPEKGKFRVTKAQGKLANLRALLAKQPPADAVCGIGHTRWATHGVPSDINSHPHAAGIRTLPVSRHIFCRSSHTNPAFHLSGKDVNPLCAASSDTSAAAPACRFCWKVWNGWSTGDMIPQAWHGRKKKISV
jgi:hypothetical protein